MRCPSRSHRPGAMLSALFACVATLVAFVPNLPAQAQGGRDLYLNKCAVCHGEDGAGKTVKDKKVHCKDIRQTIKKDSEADMIKIVTDGKGANMDGFKSQFTPDQIRAVVEYYRSLAK
jgi:mono/diheme cytochrome c family protein